jgi:hypothetical protein
MMLADWPLPFLHVKCGECGREGRMSKEGLLERFGPDREIYTVRAKLTEPTCKRPDKKQPCKSILPDALLVQAILAEDDADVIKPELLPEAREWRQKLAMGER